MRLNGIELVSDSSTIRIELTEVPTKRAKELALLVGESVDVKTVDAPAPALDSGDALRDRLCTIIDEAFGLQPVMTADELLTLLERRLFEDRAALDALQRRAAIPTPRALAEVERLREEADRIGKEWSAAFEDRGARTGSELNRLDDENTAARSAYRDALYAAAPHLIASAKEADGLRAALTVIEREAERREGDYASLEYEAADLLRELRREVDAHDFRFERVRAAMKRLAGDGRQGWEARALAKSKGDR